jgi:hypothetical protein
MTFKSESFWYLLGVLLLMLSGLIRVDNRFYYFGLLGLGWLSLVFALRQGGPARPGTAIVLLLGTNLAFLWTLEIAPADCGASSSGRNRPFWHSRRSLADCDYNLCPI